MGSRKSRMRTGRARTLHLVALAAGVSFIACRDDGAYVGGVNGALAVGAYHSLGFGDACSGGGKINFCSTERVTEVLELRSEHPDIVELLPQASHPRADVAKSPYYILGKKPGEASLTFKARFDDGSVRAASVVVQVKAPDAARLSYSCGGTDATNILLSLGDKGQFEVELLSANEKLVGWLPGAVAGEGLTDVSADSDATYYEWQAPAVAGVQNLQPGVVRKVAGTMTAFGPGQVTSIDLKSRNEGSPAAFSTGGSFYVNTSIRVQGQSPCQSLPVELHSQTPAICTGPAGETVWMGDTYGGAATVYAEGNCVLGVSMPGGPVLTTKTFPMFFVSGAPAGLDIPGYGNACPVAGGTACAYGYSSIGVCKDGRWIEKSTCASNQTCDFVPDSTSGCQSGASCAVCRGLR